MEQTALGVGYIVASQKGKQEDVQAYYLIDLSCMLQKMPEQMAK